MIALIDLFPGGARTWILRFLGQSLCSRQACRLMRSLPRARAFSSTVAIAYFASSSERKRRFHRTLVDLGIIDIAPTVRHQY